MTELQKIFLFYTFMYFMVKGALFVALYVVTIILEKKAREKHALLQAYLAKKRAEEKKRWQTAYNLYLRKYQPAEKIKLSRAA
ncbi:hypothetical protein SAMN02745221_01174 [Thermosyntropha lipolytica DSM 11003]|uniref:Uncharacterized protein n=1 Tax=Thermosyntropha lipolytica DSM 11003 TaxID=1123382 RepID=A0A1M5NFC4_9FIRM|nr:hypothetical protein [Thermosyntropha lipolytica]SHG87663.1 hypothetical protein SAMN02745221_01174 [Thermosyntropha lipolytica DSM 11003]